MEREVHEFFTLWDWGVVIGYMLLTTWIGHRMSGKQANIKDFFLGGKKLPWWSVSGSMLATEVSALTFVGVPGMVYAAGGDWTYLQWGFGSIIARTAVAYWLVPLYYEKEIYSPYDFMGDRLGEGVKRLVTFLFSLGAILGQSVRVVVTAIILSAVSGVDPILCIFAIGVIAVLWTFMGGMQTVIWTDVMQFCLFVFGGMLALGILIGQLGWDQIIAANHVMVDGETVNKMRWLDLATPFQDPVARYTLMVGLLTMPFQNFTAFGIDQLNTQRMFCCGTVKEARKAMCWSSVSILITLLMLAVGSGLFAFYQINEPSGHAAELIANDNSNVFPVWITMEIPVGVTGLILAGAFAAAISSLDSILAALSQSSLSIFCKKEQMEDEQRGEHMVRLSRIMVCVWGLILTLAGILLWYIRTQNEDSDLIGLAFGMVAYTYGPLLGVLLAALVPLRANLWGLVAGTILSILLVGWFREEIPTLLEMAGLKDFAKAFIESRPKLASEWFFALNAALTFSCGLIGGLIVRDKE